PNARTPGNELFNASPAEPSNWREELMRVDHNFSPKLRGMFRFIHDSSEQATATPFPFGGSFPTIQTMVDEQGISIVARLSANPSTTLLNEFVFSYTTDYLSLTDRGPWQRPPS